MKRSILSGALLIALCGLSISAHADMVSFFLTQTSEDDLPDGPNYARVDIEDVGDDVQFTVTPLLSGLGFDLLSNFGIQTFRFNEDGVGAIPDSIVDLPTGWAADDNGSSEGGFGVFDLTVGGQGNERVTQLMFLITDVDGDSPSSYATGNPFFVVHIADFDGPNGITSAWFAGSTVVPVPAALPLLLSGLAGFGLIARRRRRAVG